jgi:hypothetical protein
MGQMILWLQAVLPTPSPTPNPAWDKAIGIISNVLTIVKGYPSIMVAVAAIAANPYWFLASIGVSVLSILGIYLFIKAKIKKAEVDSAKKQTDADYQNQIDTRIPDNQTANEKDNANRDKLDQIH